MEPHPHEVRLATEIEVQRRESRKLERRTPSRG